MQLRVQKQGNSLTVRIPIALADEVGLTDNSLIEMSIKDGQVVIRPLQTQQYHLDNLLAQITDDNLHGEVHL